MGIQGLIPMLKAAQEWRDISEYSGQTVAIDAYVWLHKGAFSCAEELVRGKYTPKLVNYCMHRVRLLKYHGVIPYIVFDGGHLPAKMGTETERALKRDENLAKANASLSQGRLKDARELFTKCIDVTPELAYQFIKALRAENVSYVVAPYEADAQLAYLERRGLVSAIITEDSDLLVFGCQNVLFKMDGDGKCCEVSRDRVGFAGGIGEFRFDGWGDREFRWMAILSGCDYIDSINGIGIKTAHKLLRKYKTVEKVLQSLRLEGKEIPKDYRDNFRLAELTFLHQRVYCPESRMIVPLSPLPDGFGDEEGRYIGPDLDPSVARSIANGDRNPITKELIVDPWPEFMPQPVKTPIKHQPKISDLFKRIPKATQAKPSPVKRTVSAPIPYSQTTAFASGSGSGRQKLSDLTNNGRSSFSGLSEVSRGKLPEKAAPIEEEEAEGDGDPTAVPPKTSKFFSSSAPAISTPAFRTASNSDAEDVEMEGDDGPKNLFDLALPSSSPGSLSPCPPLSPQPPDVSQVDSVDIFSSPSAAKPSKKRIMRPSSSFNDGYISSSPPPFSRSAPFSDYLEDNSEREDELGELQFADLKKHEQPEQGQRGVDLQSVCLGGERRAREHSLSSVISGGSAEAEGEDEDEDEDEDEKAAMQRKSEEDERKKVLITRGWRERFSLKRPGLGIASSPVVARPSPVFARSISGPSKAASSRATPSRRTSLPGRANEATIITPTSTPVSFRRPAATDSEDQLTPRLLASTSDASITPRTLPPRFAFASKSLSVGDGGDDFKENALGAPSTATAPIPLKRKAPSLSSSSDLEPLMKTSSPAVSSHSSPGAAADRGDEDEEEDKRMRMNARRKLDVFRFRPKHS